MNLNSLPHDTEAESALLGAMISSKQALEQAVELLETNQFYLESHRLIFEAMRDEAINGSGVLDVVTLCDHLRSKNQLSRVGGATYVSSLQDCAFNCLTIEAHTGIIKRHHKARSLINSASNAINAINAHQDVDDVQARLMSEISDMTKEQRTKGGSLINLTVEAATKVLSLQRGEVNGLMTGIEALDDYLQGLKDGEMYLIAARPRVGKSTLVDQIAVHGGQKGPVLILITEMSPIQRASRQLSAMTGVPLTHLNMGLLSSSQREMIQDVQCGAKKAPSGVYVESAAGLTAGEARFVAKKFAAHHGKPVLVVLDYIQQLRALDPRAPLYERTGEKSGVMRNMSAELDCPVIVISQLGRECEKEKRPPRISDLRESGKLEEDAYAIGLMHRPDDEVQTKVVFNLAKHRNGGEALIPLTFKPEVFRFEGRSRMI